MVTLVPILMIGGRVLMVTQRKVRRAQMEQIREDSSYRKSVATRDTTVPISFNRARPIGQNSNSSVNGPDKEMSLQIIGKWVTSDLYEDDFSMSNIEIEYFDDGSFFISSTVELYELEVTGSLGQSGYWYIQDGILVTYGVTFYAYTEELELMADLATDEMSGETQEERIVQLSKNYLITEDDEGERWVSRRP